MTDLAESTTRLTTQPEPPGPLPPGRRSPLAVVRGGWRQLTSMRTALLLLFLLALAAVPGSLLPQRGLNPVKVSAFFRAHPTLAPVLDKLSFFDVFAAPWFGAIYLLLFVSLIGCLVPRIQWHLRVLRSTPPATPRHLLRLPASTSWTTNEAPEQVVSRARDLLRSKRFRVDVRDDSVGAEAGYLRETGNLVFHVALVLLLLAVALGGLFGYKGTVLVSEGDGFANSVSAYDTFRPGRLFHDGQLSPFSFTLTKFSASYQANGEAKTFDARVRYRTGPTSPEKSADVRVNSPLSVGGAKVYLVGHGYAPRFVVRDGKGQVAFDGAAPFLPRDNNFTSAGVVKAPDARPAQLGFSGFFFPTAAPSANGIVSTFPGPQHPQVTILAWRGNLGLDTGVPQSVYALDTSHLTRVGVGLMSPGDTLKLKGGGSITFTGYDQWATFQVTHDPGNGLALLAAVFVIAGLLPSLLVRRRRVWVRARPEMAAADAAPDGPGTGPRRTVVEVAGLARTDADGFAEELDEIAGRLRPAGKG